MPIQPLSKVKSDASIHMIPPDPMKQRPDIAVHVAECIAEWAQVECGLGVILAVILETEAQTGLRMFSTLTSSNNQMAIVEAAARAKLTSEDEGVFSALLMLIRSAAKDRHKLAHWCWLISDDLPDALLLMEPAHQAPFLANLLGLHDPLADLDRNNIFVLRKADAEDMAKNIKSAKELLIRTINVFWETDRAKRAEARQKLSSEPRMAEALFRLRERRKSTPAIPE